MKIVKETYGSTKSALVSLYYVIFSEFNATQNTLNGAINTQYPSFNPRLTTTSMNQFEELDSEVDSDNLFFGSAEEKNNLHSITGKSISTESMMGPASASISSSGQSTSKSASDTSNEIKYVEEGIDYEKTPKPLVLMKLGLVCIFLISAGLSSLQFGLNRQWDNQHNQQLGLLEELANCEESIATLLMMSRNFLNINIGLEPNNSTYFEDRRKYLTNISLAMIENSRISMKNIQQYMTSIQGQKNYHKDFK